MEDGIKKEIEQLKREKDVVILAHYYVDGEVQALADFVGDSYFLAKKATEKKVLFCGTSAVFPEYEKYIIGKSYCCNSLVK